jgi:hypothetical protein
MVLNELRLEEPGLFLRDFELRFDFISHEGVYGFFVAEPLPTTHGYAEDPDD